MTNSITVRDSVVDALVSNGNYQKFPTRADARQFASLVRETAKTKGIKVNAPVKVDDQWKVSFSFGKTLSLHK